MRASSRAERAPRAALTAALVAACLAPTPAWAADAATALGRTLSVLAVIPFALLLLGIAVLPLVAPRFWEHNRNKAIVALLCGVPVAVYVGLQDPTPVLHELVEYISFIVLLGSLFVICGGLVLRGDIQATPQVNALFLAVGAVLANVIGTTGASMVLIRPLLRTNSQRRHVRHIPVFFIFLVSNIGGALTPLGDPPLFLGYLRGVPFLWTLRLLPLWGCAVGAVLFIFTVWDRAAYAREAAVDRRRDLEAQVALSLVGKPNLLFLGGVVGAVFLAAPYREVAMAAMASLSLWLTPRALRVENRFTFGPIVEVAVLFLGIFLAMIPALAILEARGAELGLTRPWQFFWATGGLSSFLDNAPTYLTFMSLGQSLGQATEVVGMPHVILLAVSAGAVFMGANSYIGNGPNFMVKAIAEEARVPMPTFFGYMAYAALVLWPIFAGLTFVFFR